MRHVRAAFTFIEVICVLLVITIGLVGVIGLVSWGLIVAQRAQGTCTGMITAISVAVDPRPLIAPEMQSSWTYTPWDLDDVGDVSNETDGFINGYYVKRVETSKVADVVARDPLTSHVHARSVCVAVDVFDTMGGALVTSYNTRFVRQRGTP
jgi:hypothetical protein